MKLALFASTALLALASVSAGEHHSHHVRVHHHSHQMKFRETEVVAARAQCPRGGSVVLCESLTDECQTDPKAPSTQVCLPRDPAKFLTTVDAKSTGPWATCSYTDSSLPSKCLFSFECLCDDFENKKCYCAPPDAFRMGRGTPNGCTKSDGKVGCDAGKYCRTKGSKQECADAPYLPGLGLYAQCDGKYKGTCQDGLTCKKYSSDFSMCVKK